MTLQEIQQKLKAPKNQTNKFGGFNYRSCEDILEAVKPLLGNSVLTLSDEIVCIGERYYVKATAKFESSADTKVTIVTAYARESEDKKGMDSAQITGAASSYARKYALNGLFLIDDTKDADTQDNREKQVAQPAYESKKSNTNNTTVDFKKIVADLQQMFNGTDVDKYVNELKQSGNFSQQQLKNIDRFAGEAHKRIQNSFDKQSPIDNIVGG